MGYVCNECGNDNGQFSGYQNITEFCSENITVKADGEITDYSDHEVNDSEVTETHIKKCADCGLENIKYLNPKEYEKWQKEHFDENGEFIKKKNIKETGFSSVEKLRLLTDDLLSNSISLTEYRQKKIEILAGSENEQ